MDGSEGKPDGGIIERHLWEAHAGFRSERQLADYLAQLDCARILAASPASLASLVALREERRVEVDEKQSFEGAVRTRTLQVLWELESG